MTFITNIRLNNITSHTNTEITFKEGLNVLLGENGTGKSSVLKMIGHVLFNSLPSTQSDYVRKGKDARKSGSVTVNLIGKDNQEYAITRSVAGNTNVEVKDVRSGKLLRGINTVSDLKDWLKEQMEIGEQYDLNTIFENAIGVPQGTFTAPFLETPSKRKATFRPLLNVDIYRKLYKNYLAINHEFDDRINELDKDVRQLQGSLEGKEKTYSQKKEIRDQLSDLTAKIASLQKKHEKIKKKYQILEQLREKRKKILNNIEIQKNKQKNTKENLKKIKTQVKEAQEAKHICEETSKAYKRYKVLEKEEKKFRDQQTKLNKLKDKLKKLNNAYIKRESNFKRLTQDIKEIEGKNDRLKELKDIHDKYKKLEKQLEKLNHSKTKILNYEEQLSELTQTQNKKKKTLSKIKEKAKKIPSLKEKVSKIDEIQETLTEIEKQTSAQKTKLSNLKKNKRLSKGGMCPFLHEKCKNIGGGDLEDYFQEKIETVEESLEKSKSKLQETRKQLRSLKKGQKKLNKLSRFEGQISGLQNELDEIRQKTKKLKGKVEDKETIINALQKTKESLNSLEKDVNEYINLKNEFEKKLPDFKARKKVEQENIQRLKKKMSPLKKKIEELRDVPEKLDKIIAQKDGLSMDYHKYIEHQKLKEKLDGLLKELSKIKEKLKSFTQQIKTLNLKKNQVEEKYNEEKFEKLKEEKSSINATLAQKIGIKQEKKNRLEELKETIRELKKKERKLEKIRRKIEKLERINAFSQTIRSWFNEAGPKITEVLLGKINQYATEIFSELMDDLSVQLVWQKDYDILIRTPEREKVFSQLSGGEQMSAAIAVRLAILKFLSNVDFAFFDEPTSNLDEEKRRNLAKSIQKIQGSFKQLFVISHDDTFEEMADFVVRFEREPDEPSRVNYLSFEGEK